jgi:hypothetical protein
MKAVNNVYFEIKITKMINFCLFRKILIKYIIKQPVPVGVGPVPVGAGPVPVPVFPGAGAADRPQETL